MPESDLDSFAVADDDGLTPGECVVCQVTKLLVGGYSVLVLKNRWPGFIFTGRTLRPGEKVLAKFIRIDNQLARLAIGAENPKPSQSLSPLDVERSDPDVLSFAVPAKIRLKRACDLIPVSSGPTRTFKMSDSNLDQLIEDLEAGAHTGCVLASSQEWRSRSLMLLYRGTVVGSLYSCASEPETQPTEESLQLMLADLLHDSTEVTLYELKESVVLSLSALFLGFPVERNDSYDPRRYMDYIYTWVAAKKLTSCLAVTLPTNVSTCLVLHHKGEFAGAYHVEEQAFSDDITFVHKLLSLDPKAHLELSVLPSEPPTSFGFSLREARRLCPRIGAAGSAG